MAFVTGDKELDAILATFETKEVKKAVRKATRATVKNVTQPEYRKLVEQAGLVETAAMKDLPKTKAVARSRTQYGHELTVDMQKVIDKRRARGGKVGYDKQRTELFRYLWAWEFGTKNLHGLENMPDRPVAPMRRALFGSADKALAEFKRYLRLALIEVSARAKTKLTR